jgi:hypothetical protein
MNKLMISIIIYKIIKILRENKIYSLPSKKKNMLFYLRIKNNKIKLTIPQSHYYRYKKLNFLIKKDLMKMIFMIIINFNNIYKIMIV